MDSPLASRLGSASWTLVWASQNRKWRRKALKGLDSESKVAGARGASAQSSSMSSKAPRSTPFPIRISRFPAWLGALTTPSFSIRSTSEAALL